MFCKQCRYPLVGLTARNCPECGGAFDPADASSFQADPRPAIRRSPGAYTQLALALAPIAWLVLPYGGYVWARLSVGRWPVDPVDPPAEQCGIDSLLFLGQTSCCAAPLIAIMTLVLTGALGVNAIREGETRWFIWRLALTVACWVGTYMLVRIDPGWVINWFTFD